MTTVTSVLSAFGSDSAAAAAFLQASGLPMQLCLLTGNSCIEIKDDLFGYKKPFGLQVTDAYMTDEGTYVLSFGLSAIRGADGYAVDYGSVDPKSAIAQKGENPNGKPQWFTLNAKVAFESAPEGAESIFDGLVDYHEVAEANGVPFATRMQQHPVWLTGCVRFTLARGGKYGIYIDALDCTDAVFCGSGSNAAPTPHTSLTAVAVEDVSALFGAPEAATASSKSVGTSRRERIRR